MTTQSAGSLMEDDDTDRAAALAPDASVWVAASAGAGKTTVLTNRVLSLLVHGTPPARILGLTFTKAAAAEMAIRINQRLGVWASLDDAELDKQLCQLTGGAPTEVQRRRARGLFGVVLDTPGGMKIQTIHAFCQSLLRRFPLEAGIAPHFDVMDERRAAELMLEAREDVLRQARRAAERDAADDPAGARLAHSLAIVTAAIQEDGFGDLMTELACERARLQSLLVAHGGHDGAAAAIRARLGLRADEDETSIIKSAIGDDALTASRLKDVIERLAIGSATNKKNGIVLADFLSSPDRRVSQFAEYCNVFLTQDGKPRDVSRMIVKAAAGTTNAAELMIAEANRICEVCKRIKAARVAALSIATLTIGETLLAAYEAHKARAAALDYDDLILGARDLLRGSDAAAWVLFKLDGGLDHILVDEAQDTSPEQWQVIAALADEFFAGSGARERPRTVFAVGDVKQSIYSFQRADPDAFHRMRVHFEARVIAAKSQWASSTLQRSFRSTAAVLALVDGVFAQAAAADGVAEDGQGIHHRVQRLGQAGIVELWPEIAPLPTDPPAPWAPPVTTVASDSPPARLAAVIAATVRHWLDSGERLASRDRPIMPGDIMVLVRRRSGFVDELVRCLKARDVPVAGVDRMVLTEQLAVMDLIAFGQFLLLPEDDLNLAAVLKSPLIGLDEDDLFALAHGRRDGTSLWSALQNAGTRDDVSARLRTAHDRLARYLSVADYLSPFDLYSDILNRDGGRRKLLGRLGLEADDPLGEFMSLALSYQRQAAPSLQGFLHWLVSGQAQIKRDLEQGVRDEVRIMTVHGAKGLQAPIIFLPDDMQLPGKLPRLLWAQDERDTDDVALPLWLMRAADRDAISDAQCARAQSRRNQEYRRLLYVALTRAEDRLIVCGWRGKRDPAPDCWYHLVRDGLAGLAEPQEFDFTSLADAAGWKGIGARLVGPQTAPPDRAANGTAMVGRASSEPLPQWARDPAPPESRPSRPLAPSRPDSATEGEPSLVSPLVTAFGDTTRFQRGLIIHRLLQSLPELPPLAREAAARRYLARPVFDLPDDSQAAIAAEVAAVLADRRFAALFGPGSRAEVPITGVLADGTVVSGQIDRLAVSADRVVVVDYKSNRPPPHEVSAIPLIYLRQMAAYRGLLQGVYPDRRVDCALLWTDGPQWMEIPAELLDRQRLSLAP